MIDPFNAHDDEPRWLAWREEMRGEGDKAKPTKVPYSARTGGRARANDPRTWATRWQAESYCRERLNGATGGIGIALGSIGAVDPKTCLAGLDLDSSLDEAGDLAQWARPILDVVASYAEISPSGRGLKVFFYLDSADVRPFLDMISVEANAWGCKRGIAGLSGSMHGPGIELYCSHRYFTVTGRLWGLDHQRIERLDRTALDALAKLIPGPPTKGTGDNKGRDSSRSAKAFRAAAQWYRSAKDPDYAAMRAMLRQHADAEITDWVRAKGEAAGERELLRLWHKISTARDDDAEIARLAKLKPLQYEREREAAAERLGCRVTMLDRMVTALRGEGQNGNQGKALELPDPEPWEHPVDGGSLLDHLVAMIRRYIVIEQAAARAVALWILAAHSFTAFNIFPRLFVTGPEAGCGKTTLLDLLGFLVPRPLSASNVSPAALFRTIAALQPALLLDEFDAYTKEVAEELRQIIDAGHKRGGAVIRVVGDNHEPRLFDAYCPLAIAAIGKIASTLMTRSIVVRLRRRLASEPVASLRLDRPPAELGMLARQAARWAKDHAAALAEADPATPATIINRIADNWRPLFAVASLVGDGWHDTAQDTAHALIEGEPAESSIREQLLTDIRAIFAARHTDRLASESLIAELVALEDRPWPEWGRLQHPMTKVQLARLLKPLGISPGTIRLAAGVTSKGYKLDAFADAFARYIPAADPPK